MIEETLASEGIKYRNRLFSPLVTNLEKEVQSEQLWCGRHVKVFDGSSVDGARHSRSPKSLSTTENAKNRLWVPFSQIRSLI